MNRSEPRGAPLVERSMDSRRVAGASWCLSVLLHVALGAALFVVFAPFFAGPRTESPPADIDLIGLRPPREYHRDTSAAEFQGSVRFRGTDAEERAGEEEPEVRAFGTAREFVSDKPVCGSTIYDTPGFIGGGGRYGARFRALRPGAPLPGRRLRGGGTADDVLEDALHWLLRHQQPDGRWTESRCCSGPATPDDVATTANVIRAIVAAGITPDSPDVIANRRAGAALRDALHWLSQQQEPDGRIGSWVVPHSLALRAMADALRASDVPHLRDAATRAVAWLLEHEGYAGLWSWQPDPPGRRSDVDVSATAAALHALHAADGAGVRVPSRCVRDGVETLVREAGGGEWVPSYPWGCSIREWWCDFVGFDVARIRFLSGGPALTRDFYEGWWPVWERASLGHRAFTRAVEYAVATGDPRARAFVLELVRALTQSQEKDACARGSWRASSDGRGYTAEATASCVLALLGARQLR
jgi:hypothetical protein